MPACGVLASGWAMRVLCEWIMGGVPVFMFMGRALGHATLRTPGWSAVVSMAGVDGLLAVRATLPGVEMVRLWSKKGQFVKRYYGR
jgi:hypothetical protein